MKKNKFIALSLSFSLSCMVFPTVSLTSAYADTSTQYSTSVVTSQPPQESDYTYLKQERSIWTKIAKSAISAALKRKGAVVAAAERYGGKEVAQQVSRHYDTISKAITPLLEWTEIPERAAYDVVYRALKEAKVPEGMASTVALVIRDVLRWAL